MDPAKGPKARDIKVKLPPAFGIAVANSDNTRAVGKQINPAKINERLAAGPTLSAALADKTKIPALSIDPNPIAKASINPRYI
ncbi:unnamed protein product [marine sediment metagenome]|uniref:Uncharacterized protein n=1 Tax=marine sediment metagenome TaxID=412755 RepID=X0Z5E5_9ZZZZ